MTNDKWISIGLPSVDTASQQIGFEAIGWTWSQVGHITATDYLARAFRKSGTPAISLVELIDVIVWDALPGDRRIPIASYPSMLGAQPPANGWAACDRDPIATELSSWRRDIMNKRASLALRIDNALRSHLQDQAADRESARVLRQSVSDLRQAIMFLIQSNFYPSDFAQDEPMLRVATDAWQFLEARIPEIVNIRSDIWTSPTDLATLPNAHSVGLKRRIDMALDRVFGNSNGPRRLAYHGFYFFTPVQWAFFNLLREHPQVHQCFVIHDDGRGRAFESWRHFFVERWFMPPVLHLGDGRPTERAQALEHALTGRHVKALDESSVRMMLCKNSAEFVRAWSNQKSRSVTEGLPRPLLFAPGHQEVNRIVERMGHGVADKNVNLADLPVGQFLLALHDCVEFDGSGNYELTLSAERLRDMASSGFLDGDSFEPSPSMHGDAIARALPFFDGIREIDTWCERAEALERLLISEVALLGQRRLGLSDIERMANAANNELRLAPWCDLSADEARAIRHAILRIRDLVHEIIKEEQRRPEKYLEWLRRRLARAMANLTPTEREEIEAKLKDVGFSLEEDLELETLTEIIEMILFRETDLGNERNDAGLDEGRAASDIRALDALGFQKAESDVHIGNLADTNFPSSETALRWPFDSRHLRLSDDRLLSLEILNTREDTVALGDLYLFWLALDGVHDDRNLTLSWISETSREIHNPSPLLTLISKPTVNRAVNIPKVTGGLEYLSANASRPPDIPIFRLDAHSWDSETNADVLALAAQNVPSIPGSAALACPRRFAIQWALGPSAAYQSSHQHAMLFGNLQGVLHRRNRFLDVGTDRSRYIRRLTKDLWRQLTPGQRKSSFFERRIQDLGQSAHWKWIFTLGGSRGERNVGPTDRAYQLALSDGRASAVDLIGAAIGMTLPPAGDDVDYKICNMCPVAPRCAERKFKSH
jgi:hypothetical protein